MGARSPEFDCALRRPAAGMWAIGLVGCIAAWLAFVTAPSAAQAIWRPMVIAVLAVVLARPMWRHQTRFRYAHVDPLGLELSSVYRRRVHRLRFDDVDALTEGPGVDYRRGIAINITRDRESGPWDLRLWHRGGRLIVRSAMFDSYADFLEVARRIDAGVVAAKARRPVVRAPATITEAIEVPRARVVGGGGLSRTSRRSS
ncbi:MAG: hypothetical protein K8W52_29075 [Deltaproteobacteria bacterium]|nr:hypothetical protein [Deltaproteobacteria bacterium]